MFAERLRTLRKEAGMTQRQLGELLSKTKNNISQYESGRRTPDLDTARIIADHFNVTLDYLTGRSDYRRGRLVTAEELEKFLPAELVREVELKILVDDEFMELKESTKKEIKKVLREQGYLK